MEMILVKKGFWNLWMWKGFWFLGKNQFWKFGKPCLRSIDFGIINFEKGDLYENNTRCMIWKILCVYSIKCFES